MSLNWAPSVDIHCKQTLLQAEGFILDLKSNAVLLHYCFRMVLRKAMTASTVLVSA